MRSRPELLNRSPMPEREPRQPGQRPPANRPPVRVVLLGFGVVGRGVLRGAARRPGLDIVGIIVRRPELDGRPATKFVAEAPPGLRLSTNGPAVLATTRPDVVLVATRSTLPEVLPHLRLAASTGVAVACTAEELAYIEPDDSPEAAAIFALSEDRQVPIVALGLNPGFLLDVWPLMLAAIASDIESIEALRIVDVSGFGPQVRASLGIGHSPADFDRGLAEGRIGGHRGFRESLRLIGAALGRPVDATTVETLPIMAQRDRSLPDGAIRRGDTAGVSQVREHRRAAVAARRDDRQRGARRARRATPTSRRPSPRARRPWVGRSRASSMHCPRSQRRQWGSTPRSRSESPRRASAGA